MSNEIKVTRTAPGYYTTPEGYEIIQCEDGFWYVTAPDALYADDFYHTLREAKRAIQYEMAQA